VFFRRCGTVFFGQRLENADCRDICRNLLLRRTLADPVLALYAEIAARPIPSPRRLFVR
jgi:hypothetical protein